MTSCPASSGRRGPTAVLLLLAAFAVGTPCVQAAPLGRPGFLVIAGAADSTAGFRWQAGPGAGQRTLTWSLGMLTLPDTLVPEPFGPDGLLLETEPMLSGTSDGGGLVFRDGRYEVRTPLLLEDGRLRMYVTGGALDITGERIRYEAPRPPEAEGDPRAGRFLLAGMVLLVLVLLRLARRRGRELGR